jgi:hypothetical protein
LFFFTQNGSCRGVYDEEKTLKIGVDYWSKKFPNETLVFEFWQTNKSAEPDMWDWVYISPNSNLEDLKSGGADFLPNKEFWGKNLVGLKFVF